MAVSQKVWEAEGRIGRVWPATDRPVCTLEELAQMAVDVVAPVDRLPEGADRATILLGYTRELLRRRNNNEFRVIYLSMGEPPKTQKIYQCSALEWWKNTFKGLPPPARLAEIIEPAPVSNPRGDISLEDLEYYALKGGVPREQAVRIQADTESGALRLASRCLSGHFMKDSKVTYQRAYDWLKKNGCKTFPRILHHLEAEDAAT